MLHQPAEETPSAHSLRALQRASDPAHRELQVPILRPPRACRVTRQEGFSEITFPVKYTYVPFEDRAFLISQLIMPSKRKWHKDFYKNTPTCRLQVWECPEHSGPSPGAGGGTGQAGPAAHTESAHLEKPQSTRSLLTDPSNLRPAVSGGEQAVGSW